MNAGKEEYMHVQDCMSKSASATGYNKRSMYCLHMEIVSRDTRGSHLYLYIGYANSTPGV